MVAETLNAVLDRLAEYENDLRSVVSLYLDLTPEQRPTSKPFVESAAKDHEELRADFDRIREYLKQELQPSTQTLALFSCAAEPRLFEALQLEGAIDGHRLYLDREPHLFPLAR